jgi:hypothetical protein
MTILTRKQVSLAIKTNATIPKEYDMAPITSPVPMEIFSETKDGMYQPRRILSDLTRSYRQDYWRWRASCNIDSK